MSCLVLHKTTEIMKLNEDVVGFSELGDTKKVFCDVRGIEDVVEEKGMRRREG